MGRLRGVNNNYGTNTGSGGFFGFNPRGSSGVNYSCLVCHNKFSDISSRCGSKMKRADF